MKSVFVGPVAKETVTFLDSLEVDLVSVTLTSAFLGPGYGTTKQ